MAAVHPQSHKLLDQVGIWALLILGMHKVWDESKLRFDLALLSVTLGSDRGRAMR